MSTSNFKNADSILSVTLRKNQFSAEENSFIGRVTRNTVTLENLIASISEKNAGVSPYMIQHMANLLGDEMLSTRTRSTTFLKVRESKSQDQNSSFWAMTR